MNMSSGTPVTDHARTRMQQRRTTEIDVDLAIGYGREIHSRDAVIYFIGKVEIEKYQDYADLRSLDGLHILCNRFGTVLTVYRNKDFRRKSFPNKRRHNSRSRQGR